jgi:hypothetical protein
VLEPDRWQTNSWVSLGKRKGLAAPTSANPPSFVVAGARNHLQANRALAFRFEVIA